ncbi:MAG: rhodanese-like domain-containing protein [Lewinella sp.]|nr:rhodanese-like domain-containing protein [Lewinella sp.]
MDITVQELKQRMDAGEDNFVLLDVREPHEREEFNIGGLFIPMGTIPQRIAELGDHREDELIVYCRSGRRSANVRNYLQQSGFSNVRNLEGGMLAWQEL